MSASIRCMISSLDHFPLMTEGEVLRIQNHLIQVLEPTRIIVVFTRVVHELVHMQGSNEIVDTATRAKDRFQPVIELF